MKFIKFIIATAMMMGGLAFVAPAANADTVDRVGSVSKTDSPKAQSKKAKKKCAKSTADTNAGGLTVLTTVVCIKADISKEMKCLAEAMKDEPVAPPRDPRAECKGKVVVNIKASIVTPPCPPGFFGGQAWLKIQIRQSIKVHALAVSIANGHVETMASFYIKLKDKVRGWSQSSCVEIPPPSCSENCEPPSYDQPDVNVTPVACVNPGQTRDVTITVSNPNDVADTARVTFRGQTVDKAVAANGQVSFTFANVPAGSYTGNALLVTASKSRSFTVSVENCPGSVDIVEIETVNDVLINNTRTIRVQGVVSPGRSATLFASACNGGSIVANKTQTVSGTFDVTVTYKAGDEVPGANTNSGCEVAAGKERVNFTLTDTVDSSIKDTGNTIFAIVEPIPDPE